MAPRQAVRCCRAVHSRLASASAATPASEGVWITDSVLASAFARYCRISPTGSLSVSRPYSTNTSRPSPTYAATCSASLAHVSRSTRRRYVSSVPGPLEARRRLGKRQMTEQLSMQLSLGGGGSLPPEWAFPNAPNLRQWQWTPPRDAALFTRGNNSDAATASAPAKAPAVSYGVPKWLIELADLVDPTGAAVELPDTPRSATAAPFFSKAEAWSDKYTQKKDHSPGTRDEELLHEFDSICREFQTLLRLAGLTVEEVHEAFDLLWGSLEASSLHMNAAKVNGSHPAMSLHADQASTLLSAVIEGVGACHLLQATDYGLDFWRSLFACVAQLPDHHAQTGTVAARVLLATPSTFLSQMTDILPSHLCAIFTSLEDGAARSEELQNREKTMAQALQHINLEQDGGSNVVRATTEQLLRLQHNHATAAGGGGGGGTFLSASSASWLFTLAHIPEVRQNSLFQTLSQLSGAAQQSQETPAAEPPAERCHTLRINDLCELLLAQWISRGYVTQTTQDDFHSLMARVSAARNGSVVDDSCKDRTDNPALAVLALAMYRSYHSRPHCVALYLSLLGCLKMLGRDAELVPSVAALAQCLEPRQPPATRDLPEAQSDFKPLALPPVGFFESLAWAADDLHIALQMHDLYVKRFNPTHTIRRQLVTAAPSRSPSANKDVATLWSIGFWNKFADRLADALDQGILTPGQVSYVLDMSARLSALKKEKQTGVRPKRSKKAAHAKYANKKRGLGAPTVNLLENLAVHFALATYLAPRCALRGVEECRSLLVTHGREGGSYNEDQDQIPDTPALPTASTASLPVLRAIFHLVTRDLDSAQPGRTSRLRWFVDIVRREHSEKEAVASGHALERWRSEAAIQYKLNAEDERRAITKALQEASQTTTW